MPTVTDRPGQLLRFETFDDLRLSRRHLLAAVGVWPAGNALAATTVRTASASASISASASASAAATLRVAAAWEAGGRHHVGLLALRAGQPVRELAALEVPTRAHGVWTDPAGRLVAVARRPGDWMLRWAGTGRAPQWRWTEPSRAFNGHALADPGRRRLYTTETDLETGAGLLGVRDANTLAKLDEWPTQGLDPHQLLWDRLAPGHLIVANGGIATQVETGRTKIGLQHMDSTLARIDARTGRVVGQWRVDDPRLSLRHLAWSTDGLHLGIAMQAEHDDAQQRAQAPVLAVFDGQGVQTITAPQALAGYGGDIAACGEGFAVSCPKADGIAHFSSAPGPGTTWRRFTPLTEACALATVADAHLWAGGRPDAALQSSTNEAASPRAALGERRLDNHWHPA